MADVQIFQDSGIDQCLRPAAGELVVAGCVGCKLEPAAAQVRTSMSTVACHAEQISSSMLWSSNVLAIATALCMVLAALFWAVSTA